MCDLSYVLQVEAIERLALAQIALVPHLKEEAAGSILSPAEAVAEFDKWLSHEPEVKVRTLESDLRELLGIGAGDA